MAISKIKKNSLETGIIDEELVTADVITEQTDLGANVSSGDTILVYDVSAGALKKISQTNFLNFPVISSVSPTNAVSGDGTGNHTFTITGTGFSGASADLLNASGAAVSFDTVTVDSSTQITGVIAKSSLPGSGEPYDVRVTAASGLKSTLDNQINIDQQPVFSTAAGSLYSGGVGGYSNITVAAADPESGGDVTYTLESGSLPAGLSGTSTSSGYVISGTPTAPGSNTTSNFTIRAKDVNSNTSDRAFSITINAPVIESFTSSGTFSVPSGITSVDVLVVAGGGGGGDKHAGGGGAGGLIYRPGFPVTPGGTVTVTVGCGGGPGQPGSGSPSGAGGTGQDSVFGTLTAKGGGYGQPGGNGGSGGSGGGGGHSLNSSGGTATQPTQSGDSGTYGFGNAGGGKPGISNYQGGAGAGGGGAGAVGGDVTSSPNPEGANRGNVGGIGGIGKAYTIADGTTSVYYAGGGGGSNHGPSGVQAGPGGGQPGQGGGGRGGSVNPSTPYTGPTAGTANRGGGGGGGITSCNSPVVGGSGGKGIVIVKY